MSRKCCWNFLISAKILKRTCSLLFTQDTTKCDEKRPKLLSQSHIRTLRRTLNVIFLLIFSFTWRNLPNYIQIHFTHSDPCFVSPFRRHRIQDTKVSFLFVKVTSLIGLTCKYSRGGGDKGRRTPPVSMSCASRRCNFQAQIRFRVLNPRARRSYTPNRCEWDIATRIVYRITLPSK